MKDSYYAYFVHMTNLFIYPLKYLLNVQDK